MFDNLFQKSAAELKCGRAESSAVVLFTEKTWVIAALNISNMDTQEDRRKGMILPDYAFQAAYGCDKMKKSCTAAKRGDTHEKKMVFAMRSDCSGTVGSSLPA